MFHWGEIASLLFPMTAGEKTWTGSDMGYLYWRYKERKKKNLVEKSLGPLGAWHPFLSTVTPGPLFLVH